MQRDLILLYESNFTDKETTDKDIDQSCEVLRFSGVPSNLIKQQNYKNFHLIINQNETVSKEITFMLTASL